MEALIKQASLQHGKTWPNPMTAAAVVKDGQIVSYGVHQKAGEPHAEVLALRAAGDLARGATVYVTLEPCTHTGRTPPCAKALIEAGVAEVVYAMDDPNPLVREHSAESILKAAGIRVRKGLCEKEALMLNREFIVNQTEERPYVYLKSGLSMNGKIAFEKGKGHRITSDASIEEVHRLRRQSNGILIGIETALCDNPYLNVRFEMLENGFLNPTKIVLDAYGRLSAEANLIVTSPETPVLLIQAEGVVPQVKAYPSHVRCIKLPAKDGRFDWYLLLKRLYEEGICSLLIEGGSGVYASALEAKIVDELHLFVAPYEILGEDIPSFYKNYTINDLAEVLQFSTISVSQSGSDFYFKGRL